MCSSDLRYEAGSPEAVERYMQMVLERSSYPEPITGEPDVRFDDPSKTLIISFWLPGPAEIPNILEYKYIEIGRASCRERVCSRVQGHHCGTAHNVGTSQTDYGAQER